MGVAGAQARDCGPERQFYVRPQTLEAQDFPVLETLGSRTFSNHCSDVKDHTLSDSSIASIASIASFREMMHFLMLELCWQKLSQGLISNIVRRR